MSTGSHDVAVIGGGIVGTSASFYLARRGMDVILLEKETIGAGASGAAAGILTDPMFVRKETPYREMASFPRLNRASYRFYPTFLDELREFSDVDPGYRQNGGYYLAFDEEQLKDRRSYFREMEKYDQPSDWLDPDDVQQAIDGINTDVKGGFFYEEEAHVAPDQIMLLLEDACSTIGVIIREQTEVVSVINSVGTPGVKTHDGTISCDRVLVTAGAWTRSLLERIGVELPVYPRKGEMIRLKSPVLEDIPLLRQGEWYMVPRGDRSAVVGATMYPESGFDQEVTSEGRAELLREAQRLLPPLTESDIVDSWAGLRPYADRKGGPFLGPLPGHDDVYVCAGHYRNGITQGPFSAKLIVQEILDEETEINLSDYRPEE